MAYFYKQAGWTYFAKHCTRDVVKIGFSRNPETRVRELRWRRRGRCFELLGGIPGLGIVEAELHKRFAFAKLPTKAGHEFFRYSVIKVEIEMLPLVHEFPR